MSRLNGYVEKGWGHELIWATNDKYCGKLLNFKTGGMFSMHMHQFKDETWYVLSGEFDLEYIDTQTATLHRKTMRTGDVWRNEPMVPHRLICISQGTIVEVSTADSVEDNFRIMPGDSQKFV